MISINQRLMNIKKFTHHLLEEVICDGDHVIDGTVGNGHDTVYLAKAVGAQGKVFGFDVQAQAIERTKILLDKEGCSERVELFHCGHENISRCVPTRIKAAMFNLGYLPKGDREIITLPATTIEAVEGAMEKLVVGGVISIMVYSGHPGGQEESNELLSFLKKINKKQWDILKWEFMNRATSPYLIVISHKEG